MHTAISQPSPMVKVGRSWFRWRSLSPVPLFLMLMVAPPTYELSSLGIAFVLMGIGLAEGLRIWAVGYAGSATRTRGDTVPDFVHAGPFRYVRNPLYVANIAMYTLVGALFGSVFMTAFIFFYSCLQYSFIVAFEEDLLSHTFGAIYANYRGRVPRWMVSVVPRISSSAHTFDLKRALISEKSTFFSMALMGILYLIKQNLPS